VPAAVGAMVMMLSIAMVLFHGDPVNTRLGRMLSVLVIWAAQVSRLILCSLWLFTH
jgi:hypothetical protein